MTKPFFYYRIWGKIYNIGTVWDKIARSLSGCVRKGILSNAESMKGVDLYEKAFLQTSLVKGHEINACYHLRIYVPEEREAVYLGNVNEEQ